MYNVCMYQTTNTPPPSPPLSMALLLHLLLLSLVPSALSLSSPFNYSLHIDSGALLNSTDSLRTPWLSDRFYSGGASSVVSEPLIFPNQQEKNLRYFPISFGKKNCYSIPDDGDGRYLLRVFTVYDNYDGKSRSPSFDVSVDGTLVFSWRSPWSNTVSRTGAYSGLFFNHRDSDEIDVCFYSIGTDSPVVGSLELTRIDPNAYAFQNSTANILINYGRFSARSGQWGPGFTNDTDLFGRAWQPDADFRVEAPSFANGAKIVPITTAKTIANVEISPNYFPEMLYQTAVTAVENGGGGILEYEFEVDAKLDYFLYFHFSEIDGRVVKAGQRVFDVIVDEENVSRVDVYDKVGGLAAYDWGYIVKNLSSTTLNVRLESVVGPPMLSGLENYAIVPVDPKTVPQQVAAMKALKESFHVPSRMGWNGDPCAPATWDAWEGVTCHFTKDGSALVVFQIDLGSQGLKGSISDQIGLLTNLVSLNLSSNSLEGNIPSGLGQKSLVKLDLSKNKFTGSIPDSLTSASLQFMFMNDNLLEGRVPQQLYSIGLNGGAIKDLSKNKFTGSIPDSLTSASLQFMFLNDNLLEGRVPQQLYSIGLNGGAINLDRNKRLCGGPSLPDCSMLWGKHGLSTVGKVGIGLSCLVIIIAVVLGIYYMVAWRHQNEYSFGFPHEMLAIASKRNRYQRQQKSMMALEMESQHAKKGFIPTYNIS